MSNVNGFREGIAAWVHETARARPLERVRHEAFIATRLVLSLTIAALVPPYLALRGVPALWETLVFFTGLVPLVSVGLLSRTGDLVRAHLVSACGLLAAALTLSFGLGGLSAAALIWLALAPVEAMFAMSTRLVLGVSLGAVATLFTITIAASCAMLPADVQGGVLLNTLIVIPAIAYAGGIAFGAMKLHDLRVSAERIGAARYEALAGVMGDVLLRHDRGGAVLYASRECEALFDLTARDLVGRGLFERICVQDRPAFLKCLSDACSGARTVRTEFRLRIGASVQTETDYEEPVFRWVEMRARRLALDGRDAEADQAVAISILRDITREKQAEVEREEALAAADRANAWKDRFLASFSHELRTPLNAIIGFSEILSNEAVMPEARTKRSEYASIIHASGQHLLSVVNAILDMSKIEAGRFDIETEPFEIGPLVDSCCDMVKLKAEQSGIELVRDCPADLPELVADKRACKQILLNLLSNALKFTQSGGRVSVAVRLAGKTLAIEVADTGIGITKSDLPRLGDPFFQSAESYDRAFEGTGLGLSVVRGLVGLHGGKISVASDLGTGTCITVQLPIDCRATANQKGSAKIEVLPLPSVQPFMSVPSKVKKIA